MNLTLMIASTVRGFGVLLLLGALILTQAAAQPQISIHIQRRDFSGNLLRLADGSFVAEKNGLYRLTPDANFDRKLNFDANQPFAGITGGRIEFVRLLAPLKDGGFLASVNFYIPGLGWFEQRLARFDVDGRLVWSYDTVGRKIRAAIESPDGRLLYAPEAEGDLYSLAVAIQANDGRWFYDSGIGGSAQDFAVQGSNVVVGGNLINRYGGPAPIETNGLLRLNANLVPDTSFRPPRCNDISRIALQSGGQIIAHGRLTDAQGVFEIETSVFRLHSDGSFDRRLLQVQANWPLSFTVLTNDEVVILNGVLLRYHSDGTLAQSSIIENLSFFEYLLPDGSFLDFWFNGDAGGPEARCQRNHWRKLKPNGQIDPAFPPTPLDDLYRVYLSVTNTLARHHYEVEQSSDLIVWQKTGAYGLDDGTGSIESINVGVCVRREDLTQPQFFRVVEVPDL